MNLEQAYISSVIVYRGLRQLTEKGNADQLLQLTEDFLPTKQALDKAMEVKDYASSKEFKEIMATKPGLQAVLQASLPEAEEAATIRENAEKLDKFKA